MDELRKVPFDEFSWADDAPDDMSV